MSMSYSRASRLASICHKEFDFQFFVYQEEVEYKIWLPWKRVLNWCHRIADDTKWNCFICIICLLALIVASYDMSHSWLEKPFIERVIDIGFNVIYFVHVVGLLYHDLSTGIRQTFWKRTGYALDFLSFGYYILFFLHMQYGLFPLKFVRDLKILCYYVRLHHPLKFLLYMNDNNLTGSVIGTTLKYMYIFCFMRVTFALLMIQLIKLEILLDLNKHVENIEMYQKSMEQYNKHPFLWCFYLVDKLFSPIGPEVYPFNDLERLSCIVVMITGTLTVTGIAVATMSIVLSVYLQHEESYRARYKLIVKDMIHTKVPKKLRNKVETFYKMYWHKQKGVSGSELMATFPPTTYNLIYSEIYFEAQQKSRVLRDLSNQFLSEISKLMTTINYIPGDSIIKRKSAKSSIIYISYGDVEMMSAEDDATPMLRFSRGTILNGCGGYPTAGCASSHVEIRAATFCTAHVLSASDLWKVAAKFGRSNGQAFIISSSFQEHFERVMKHYAHRVHPPVTCKSSILFFKRNLVELKNARDANGVLLLQRNDAFLEIAGCYIMRNRADTALTEDSDRICMRSTFPCILQPTSSLQIAWSGLVAILSLIMVLTHPYHLAHGYDITPDFRFFDYFVSVIFVFDIIAHLSTGANIEEGVPITFKQTSTQQMKSLWFALDVLAVLPIFEFIGKGEFTGINKLCKLPKVFKALKEMEEVAVYHSHFLRFFSYTLVIIVATYLLACLQQGVMCYMFDYCEVTDLNTSPFWTQTKIDPKNEDTRFLMGLYWSICMVTFSMHKTMSWNIGNLNNKLYTMLVIEVIMVLRIFIESVYSATIMVTIAMKQEYETCISQVKNCLIRNSVDPTLRHRFINYLQLCWHTDKAYSITHNKQSVLFDLPPHVSSELLAMQRIKYIAELPFAKYIKETHLNVISSRARLFYSCPNEILLSTGDVCNEMYVIKQGMCEVLSPDTKRVVEVIGFKSHFGVLECLLRIPAFYTVRAVTHVQVLCILNKDLLSVVSLPKIKDAIIYAKSGKVYKNLLKSRESFAKYVYPPPLPNRCMFPLPRKHEPDTQFLLPFQRLGLLSILRYVFPRWTIRPDGRYMQRYEWFRAFCAIASAFVFPCFMYMSLQFPAIHSVATFLDYSAYFDLVQRMLVAYYNDKGILVYHPASTAAYYFRGAFIVDLLGLLPLEILDMGRSKMYKHPTKNMYLISNVSQYLACNRLLQLYRLPSALNTLSVYIEREDILLIVKGMPLLMGLLNVMTMSILQVSVKIYKPEEGTGWLLEQFEGNHSKWIEDANHLFNYDVLESPLNLHLTSYFWAVYETTSTGFNVLNPTNDSLLSILYWGNIIAMMLTTYYSVRVISIRANVNQALAEFQEHIRDMRSFMTREDVPSDLQKEVIDYYTYSWDKMGGINYSDMFKLCDQITLRTDAIMNIYGPTFNKCPVLNECDLALLRLMGRAMHSIYFLAETHLIERDDVIEFIYFVDYGTVEVKDLNDDAIPITKLPRGSIFGNLMDCATMRSQNTFMTNNNVHLLLIRTETFYQMIWEFPATKSVMDAYLTKGQNYIIGGQKDPVKSISVWKERTFSTAILIATRRGAIKMLDTHSKAMQVFLIIISLCCAYLDMYNAAFQDNSIIILIFLYLLDLLFFSKIIVNYAIANADYDKEIKLKLLKQRKIYYKGVFKYDIISLLPIELFCFLYEKEDQWEAFSFLRLNRILRLITINECFKRHLEKLNINLVLSTITSVTVWFTVMIHFTTCIWHYIGTIEHKITPNSSWFSPTPGKPPCQNKYLCAFYFTLTTFTTDGVGDIMPKMQSEVLFTCILQILSTMLYMIYVGEFSNIIQYKSFRFFSFYTKHVELMEYLKFNRVTKNLVEMMNRYTLHLWRESRGVQMPAFLLAAPQCMQTRIMSAAYMTHLTNHPTFRNCEPTFLRQLVRHLRLYSYYDGMYVVKENEITDSMYMIHTGTVEEVAEDLELQTELLHEGDNFGIAQGLQRNNPFSHSYRAVGKAKVLTLRRDDWYYLLKHFPKCKFNIFKGKVDDDEKDSEKERKHVHIRSSIAQNKILSVTKEDDSARPEESLASAVTAAAPIVAPLAEPTASTIKPASIASFTAPHKEKLEAADIKKMPKLRSSLESVLSLQEQDTTLRQSSQTETTVVPSSPKTSVTALSGLKDTESFTESLEEQDKEKDVVLLGETGMLKAGLQSGLDLPKQEMELPQSPQIQTTMMSPSPKTSVAALSEFKDTESFMEPFIKDEEKDQEVVSLNETEMKPKTVLHSISDLRKQDTELSQSPQMERTVKQLSSISSVTKLSGLKVTENFTEYLEEQDKEKDVVLLGETGFELKTGLQSGSDLPEEKTKLPQSPQIQTTVISSSPTNSVAVLSELKSTESFTESIKEEKSKEILDMSTKQPFVETKPSSSTEKVEISNTVTERKKTLSEESFAPLVSHIDENDMWSLDEQLDVDNDMYSPVDELVKDDTMSLFSEKRFSITESPEEDDISLQRALQEDGILLVSAKSPSLSVTSEEFVPDDDELIKESSAIELANISNLPTDSEVATEDVHNINNNISEIVADVKTSKSDIKIEISEPMFLPKQSLTYLDTFEDPILKAKSSYEETEALKELSETTAEIKTSKADSDVEIPVSAPTIKLSEVSSTLDTFKNPITEAKLPPQEDKVLEKSMEQLKQPSQTLSEQKERPDTGPLRYKKLFPLKKKPFVPPPGPSMKDVDPAPMFDTNIWPMNSRRRSSESVEYYVSDEEPQEEEPKPTVSRIPRKSTVYGIVRNAEESVDEEEDDETSGIPKHFVPLTIDETHSDTGFDKEEFEKELEKEVEINLADHDVLNKEENIDYLLSPIEPKETHEHRESYESKSGAPYVKRKSVVHGLDKPLVIKKIEEDEQEQQSSQTSPFDGVHAAKSALKPKGSFAESTTSLMPDRGRRKTLAEQLVSAAKKILTKERMSILGEKDTLMLEQEEQAAAELLNKPRSHSEVIFKRQQSMTADQVPKISEMPELGYKTYDPRGHSRKSILAFKDEITTFEVSKEDIISISSEQKLVDRAAGRASMLAYADDIAMKQPGGKADAEDVQKDKRPPEEKN